MSDGPMCLVCRSPLAEDDQVIVIWDIPPGWAAADGAIDLPIGIRHATCEESAEDERDPTMRRTGPMPLPEAALAILAAAEKPDLPRGRI